MGRTSGEPPDILEDFGGECVYLHCCLAEVPAPTCSPPPCSRAQRAAEPPTAARHTLQTKYACVIEDLQHHQ